MSSSVIIKRSIVFSGLLGLLMPIAEAGYYLYQLPDGSRVVSDHQMYGKQYQLVRQSDQVKGIGRMVAGAYHPPAGESVKKFETLIETIAERHDVDQALVKAVIRTESYFNPNATSRKGASGLMQLMPQTARRYGVIDLYSPQQNLDAGVRYLRDLLQRYDNQLYLALAAYNAGENAVDRFNGVPPYEETQRYVKKVMKFHAYYSKTN
ncbi:MAG: lytic transglycosylase domain-containing protein [Gammaproteobacteria bacterium]|nr:lytic transglycosylase domain-containing protein [Gammaproteobacteria bacterium]